MQLKLISLNNMGRKKPNVPRAGVKRGGKIKRKCK